MDRLKCLVADGLSASEIAAELGGVSRNAVIGKIDRMGIGDQRPARPPPKPATERKRMYRQRLKGAAGRTASNLPFRLARAELGDAAKPVVVSDPPPPLRLTILEVRECHCRYPITSEPPHLFCGRPVEPSSSWCAYCAAIVYEPSRKHDRPFMFRGGVA